MQRQQQQQLEKQQDLMVQMQKQLMVQAQDDVENTSGEKQLTRKSIGPCSGTDTGQNLTGAQIRR